LFAALIGLFVNLLSHAWADDTLAYLFTRGLAGIALSQQHVPDRKQRSQVMFGLLSNSYSGFARNGKKIASLASTRRWFAQFLDSFMP